ncbi:UNVERIFIED_CONTAM: hypothetical protein DES50_10834 [Williamsia faeni]
MSDLLLSDLPTGCSRSGGRRTPEPVTWCGNWLVPTGSGRVAVTMATTPDDGSFEEGAPILDTVATWISQNLDQLPAGAC